MPTDITGTAGIVFSASGDILTIPVIKGGIAPIQFEALGSLQSVIIGRGRRLFIDLDDQRFVASAGHRNPIASIDARRGDKIRFDVYFAQDGRVVELGSGATGKMGVKVKGQYDDDYIASDLAWQVSGTGTDRFYTFYLDLNTVEINELLGHNPPDFANDKEKVECVFEVQWIDGVGILSTKAIPFWLYNDVNKGGEGDVVVANPDGWATVPASAGAAGIAGSVAYDTDYFYVCVTGNTWKRTPLTTW